MNDEQLLSIMAAIIFAGADDCEKGSGYTEAQAVKKAARIFAYVRGSDRVLLAQAHSEMKGTRE